MRRCTLVAAAAAALVAASLVFAAPSQAAPSGSFSSPTEGATFTKTPTPTLAGSFSADEGLIDRIDISITSQDGAPTQTRQDAGNRQKYQPFSWTPTFTFNGRYTSTAVVTIDRSPFSPQTHAAQRSFTLAIPPVAPRNVKVGIDNDKRVATVTWAANPEGDIVGYVVRRSADGGPYAEAGGSDTTTFTEALKDAPGGTYTYQVIAVRKGATSSSPGLTSQPSSNASARLNPPPTTTTTARASAPTAASAGNASGTGPGTTPGATTSTTPAPAIASNGKVDLSNFASLLDRQRLPSSAGSGQALEPDGEFSETLPFGRTPRTSIVTGEAVAQGVTIPVTSSDDNGSSSSLLFLAGGLLATVVAAHVLWLKSEVDRAPLEAVTVAGPAPGPEPAARTPSRRPRPLRARPTPDELETIDQA